MKEGAEPPQDGQRITMRERRRTLYECAAMPLPILYNHNPFPPLLSSMDKGSLHDITKWERRREKQCHKNTLCRCGALANTMPITEGSPLDANVTRCPLPPSPSQPRPNHTLGFFLEDKAIGSWQWPLTSALRNNLELDLERQWNLKQLDPRTAAPRSTSAFCAWHL